MRVCEKKQFDAGNYTGTNIEVYAAAEVLKVKLKISGIDNDFNVTSEENYYTENETAAEFELMMFDEQFGVKEDQ